MVYGILTLYFRAFYITRSPPQALADKIINYHFDLQNQPPNLSTEIAEAIRQVHLDPIFTEIMDEHSSEFYLMDSAF